MAHSKDHCRTAGYLSIKRVDDKRGKEKEKVQASAKENLEEKMGSGAAGADTKPL